MVLFIPVQVVIGGLIGRARTSVVDPDSMNPDPNPAFM
jgi:hypothetical protein